MKRFANWENQLDCLFLPSFFSFKLTGVRFRDLAQGGKREGAPPPFLLRKKISNVVRKKQKICFDLKTTPPPILNFF